LELTNSRDYYWNEHAVKLCRPMLAINLRLGSAALGIPYDPANYSDKVYDLWKLGWMLFGTEGLLIARAAGDAALGKELGNTATASRGCSKRRG
jgi:hypothetical protein